MFKKDYVRAANHVKALKQRGAKPVVVDSVIDAYLAIFQSKKAFDARRWFAFINGFIKE